LERYDEALDSLAKAVALKPDAYESCLLRGSILMNLKRYEEALLSIDKALQITKSDAEVWNMRGLCLSFLEQYNEALDNLKRASELEKEEPLYLANQGIVLARAGRYNEAFAFCEQALNLKENEGGHYAKACCYALQGHDELAIESLRRAIEYSSRQCRLEAKYNPDFDCLRQNKQFQQLIEINEKKT
jgi:Flp pilus assembly protein TadD